MSTLTEIEAIVDALPAADKQELLLFLAARLRAQAAQLPAPRTFSSEQMRAWIAEDDPAKRNSKPRQPTDHASPRR